MEAEKAPEAKVLVPEELTDPHPLVASARQLLKDRKPKDGLVSSPRRRCLDIKVAPESLDRTLRIMNALLKALESRDLPAEVTPVRQKKAGEERTPDSNLTRVEVDGEWISFGLEEEYDVIKHPDPVPPATLPEWRHYWWIRDNRKEPAYVPSGRLALRIKTENLGVRRTWRDAKRQRVETCLNSFIAHLALTAAALKEERAAAERRRLEAIEAERRRVEEEKRRLEEDHLRRIEERRQKDLGEQLERGRLSEEVRAYLAEAREALTEADFSEEEKSQIAAYLEWMQGYAERLDPLHFLRRQAARWEKAEENPYRLW